MADDPRNERVGGSRHYTGQGLGTVVSWKCPRCANENTGDIQQGCANCGAGKPGEFKGVPQPIPTDHEGKKLWVEETPATDYAAFAFHTFISNTLDFIPDARLMKFLRMAFDAGVRYAKQDTMPIVEPTVDTVPVPRELLTKVLEILDAADDGTNSELTAICNQLREAME